MDLGITGITMDNPCLDRSSWLLESPIAGKITSSSLNFQTHRAVQQIEVVNLMTNHFYTFMIIYDHLCASSITLHVH